MGIRFGLSAATAAVEFCKLFVTSRKLPNVFLDQMELDAPTLGPRKAKAL